MGQFIPPTSSKEELKRQQADEKQRQMMLNAAANGIQIKANGKEGDKKSILKQGQPNNGGEIERTVSNSGVQGGLLLDRNNSVDIRPTPKLQEEPSSKASVHPYQNLSGLP